MRSPTPSFVLQASLFDSPEKSFSLPVYANTMAHASLRSRPTCAPRLGHGIDPRVLNYLDIDANVDTSFLSDYSDFGYSSHSGQIFERCANDSMSF